PPTHPVSLHDALPIYAVHSDHDVSYEVRLNGFKVLETGNVVASVRWFNDDMATQVIQVRAVAGSAAGPWSNALVVNPAQPKQTRDRKSTRLNSSHVKI